MEESPPYNSSIFAWEARAWKDTNVWSRHWSSTDTYVNSTEVVQEHGGEWACASEEENACFSPCSALGGIFVL